jgi:hypothetical protein
MNYRVGQLVTIKDRRPMFDSPVPITGIKYEQIGYPQVVEVLLRNGQKYTLSVRDIEPWRTDYIERIHELERVAAEQERELTVLRAATQKVFAPMGDLWEPLLRSPSDINRWTLADWDKWWSDLHRYPQPKLVVNRSAAVEDVKPHAAWEAEG